MQSQDATLPPRGWTAAVSRAFGVLAVVQILAVLLLTAANVVGRYALGSPIKGAEEATGYMIVGMVMFGAAEALRRGDHLRIDLLTERFGPRIGRVLDALALLSVIAVGLVLAWTGYGSVSFARSFGSYSSGHLAMPMWIVQLPLVIGGLLLALVAAGQLIALVRGRPAPAHHGIPEDRT